MKPIFFLIFLSLLSCIYKPSPFSLIRDVEKNISEEKKLFDKNGKEARARVGWILYLNKNDISEAEKLFKTSKKMGEREFSPLGLAFIYDDMAQSRNALEEWLYFVSSKNLSLRELSLYKILNLKDETPFHREIIPQIIEAAFNKKSFCNGREYFLISKILSSIKEEFIGENLKLWLKRLNEQSWFIQGQDTFQPYITFYEEPLKINPFQIKDMEKIKIRNGQLSIIPQLKKIYYAISFFELNEDREVYLVFNSENFSKIFVDGIEIIPKNALIDTIPETLSFLLELKKGIHTIIVQTLINRSNVLFNIVFVDKDGSPISINADLISMENYFSGFSGKEIKLIKPPYLSDEDNLLSLFINANISFYNKDIFRTRGELEKLKKIVPEFAPLHYLSSQVELADYTIPSIVGRKLARGELEKSLALNPFFTRAMISLAEIYTEEGLVEEGMNLYQKIKNLLPENYAWAFGLYQIFREKGWEKEAEENLMHAIMLNPENCNIQKEFLDFQWDRGFLRSHQFKGEDFHHCDFYKEKMIQFYIESGQEDMAEKELEKEIEENPLNEIYSKKLLEIYFKKQNISKALNLFERFNFSDSISFLSGEIYALSGDFKKAYKIWRGFIKNFITSSEIRKKLFSLGISFPWDDLRIDGINYIKNFKDTGTERESPALVLLDQFLSIYDTNGGSLNLVHQIVKLQKPEGIINFGEYSVPDGAEIINMRTIKRDGRILEPEEIPEKESISFPSLEEGDFIEANYIFSEPPQELIAPDFTGHRFVFQRFDASLLKSNYCVLVPQEKGMEYEFQGNIKIIDKGSEEGFKRTCFEMENQKMAFSEPISIDPFYHLPWVKVRSNLKFRDLIHGYRNRLKKIIKINYQLMEIAEEIKKKRKNRMEKIKMAYNYVMNNIKENEEVLITTSPSYTLSLGEGERLLLLKTLLNILNVNSSIVLVVPLHHWLKNKENADIFDFSYPLIKIAEKDEEIFLDPSIDFIPFGYFPPIVQKRPYLTIEDGGKDNLFETPFLPMNNEYCHLEIKVRIESGGDIEGEGIETLRGINGVMHRNIFSKLGQEKRKEDYALFLSEINPYFILKDFEIDNLNEVNAPLVIKFKISGKHRDTIFSINSIPKISLKDYIKFPSRSTPFLLNVHLNQGFYFKIELPSKTEITEKPQRQNYIHKFGSFTRSVKIEDFSDSKEIIVNHNLNIPIRVIYPEDYKEFIDFALMIDDLKHLKIGCN